MNINDLYTIIDDYNADAFRSCVDFLYKQLFRVTPKADIRRIDLKEQIANAFIHNKFPEKDIERTFVKYSEGIITYYTSFVGKRDEQYVSRRKELAHLLSKGGSSLEVVEDYFFIYLSQCYCFSDEGDFHGTHKTVEVNYYLNQTDLNTIINIFNKVKYYYTIKTVKPFLKQSQDKQEFNLFKDSDKLFIYILNILLLYRIIQYEGEI